MQTSTSIRSFKTYKYYFSANSPKFCLSPTNDKENVSVEANRTKYNFYFKKSEPQKQKKQQQKRESIKIVHYDDLTQGLIRQTVSDLIHYIQMCGLGFESFLSAATILYQFILKNQTNPQKFTSLALASVFISSKLFQIKQTELICLTELTDNKVSKKEILQAESNIMENFNFNVFLQTNLKKEIYDFLSRNDEQTNQKMKFLVQLSLLRGESIIQNRGLIKSMIELCSGNAEQGQIQCVKTHLKPIMMTQECRSLVMKWSFQIDTEEIMSKIQ